MTEGTGEEPANAAEDLQESAPSPWWPTIRRALFGMIVGTLIALLVPLLWLYPYLSDDRRLDVIVRVAALDWRDFGEKRAQSRLQYELDHAGIGPWVDDDDCEFRTEPPERIVSCSWGVALEVPGLDVVLPLSFSSLARVDDQGAID